MVNYIRRASLGLLLAGSIIDLTSCEGPRHPTPSPIEQTLAAFDLSRATQCVPQPAIIVRQGVSHPLTPVVGCLRRDSQVTDYVYRDSTGRVLVIGRESNPPLAAIATLRDSLRRETETRYGPSAKCPKESLTGNSTVQFGWDLDSLSVTVRSDSAIGWASVTWELRIGEHHCDDPVGRPISR